MFYKQNLIDIFTVR